MIWLGRGIDGDDTHGHVDDLARFVDPHTVVTVVEPRSRRPQPRAARRKTRAASDRPTTRTASLSVWSRCPCQTGPLRRPRLPASYANFYIANGLVLVPTFNDPADRVALNTLARAFPTARWSASIALTWCSAWARCIACRSNSRATPAPPPPGGDKRLRELELASRGLFAVGNNRVSGVESWRGVESRVLVGVIGHAAAGLPAYRTLFLRRWAAREPRLRLLVLECDAQNSSRPATSKPIDGHAVLTARGLTRTGKLYLLPPEIAARDKIKAGSEAFRRIESEAETLRQSIFQAQNRQAGLNDQLLAFQTQREGLNAQRQQYVFALAGQQRPDVPESGPRQIQQIDTQLQNVQDSIAQVRQSMTVAELQIQEQGTNLRRLEAQYEAQRSEFERGFASLAAAYQPLKSDPEVLEALKQLNRTARPWVMIGPEWDYDRNVAALAKGLELGESRGDSVTVSKRSGKRTTKTKVPRVTLAAQEKEIRTLGYQLRLLEPKLSDPGAAGLRRSTAPMVARLEKAIREAYDAYKSLSDDPLITSAIDIAAPGAKWSPPMTSRITPGGSPSSRSSSPRRADCSAVPGLWSPGTLHPITPGKRG